MKANEAIEIVEELLTEFREESENGLTLESDKEALETVIESAKVLHDMLNNEEKYIYCKTDAAEIILTGEQAKKIGVVE